MEITDLSPGGFACACYLVREGTDAVLIDCSATPEAVKDALDRQGARLAAILCTHGHFDHILTADALRDAFSVPLFLHEADAELPADNEKNAFSVFFGNSTFHARSADRLFKDKETLRFGALSCTVMHTPGHSKGSSVFLLNNIAFTGDTLFTGGWGRTDLYGGDALTLRHSLQALSNLSPDIRIYPGHGGSSTLKNALDLIL